MITTSLRWSSPFSIGLILTLAAVAALGFLVLRKVAGGPLVPSRRWGLRAIRLAILGVVAAILLNPSRVEETPGLVERPKVSYLIDTSESMALGQHGRTRWDQSLATIREAESARSLNAGPEVGAFRFGTRLAAIERPFWRKPSLQTSNEPGTARAADPTELPPAPTDADTLLAGSLETIAARFGQDPPRAVVVFSDGRARDGAKVGAIARGYGWDEDSDPRRPRRQLRRRRRRGDRQHGRGPTSSGSRPASPSSFSSGATATRGSGPRSSCSWSNRAGPRERSWPGRRSCSKTGWRPTP